MFDHVSRVVLRGPRDRHMLSFTEVGSAQRLTKSTRMPSITSNARSVFLRSMRSKISLRTLSWCYVS